MCMVVVVVVYVFVCVCVYVVLCVCVLRAWWYVWYPSITSTSLYLVLLL